MGEEATTATVQQSAETVKFLSSVQINASGSQVDAYQDIKPSSRSSALQ